MLDLHWLPRHADLRSAVTVLKRRTDLTPETLEEALAWLAEHRMDCIETVSADRPVRPTLRETLTGGPACAAPIKERARSATVGDMLAPYRRIGFEQIPSGGETITLWSMIVPPALPNRTSIDINARYQPAAAT